VETKIYCRQDINLFADDNELNITLSDTFDNFHTYEIDWTPDAITWLVDGQVGRTKKRSDTWNATTNQWDFPQTPARVQLSLWPAGLASNGQGTVNWAGGFVDWNSADIKNNGYYYATFESVTVSCYNATSPPGTNTGVSYTYSGYAGTNDTVVDGKNATVLASFLDTGLDMNAGASSGTSSGASPSSTAQTVPGLSGGSPADVDSHGSSSSGSAGSSGAASTDSSGATATGFSQGTSTGTSKSGADKLGVGKEKVLKGSAFAGIVAVVAVMAL
jgi:beta-glucanase (GH16 family)